MKGKEYELGSPHILYTIRDKHQPECIVESNKHGGSRKWCQGQKENNSDGVEHAQRAKASPTCT